MTGTIFTSAKKRTTLKKFFAGFMALSLNLSLGGVATVITSNVAYAAGYSITGTSTVSGLVVTLSGTASANPYTGGDTDQHIAVDWTGACSATSATEFNFSSIVYTGGSGSHHNNGSFTNATWTTSHPFSAGGTYSVCVKVYHAGFSGHEGSDAATFSANIVVPPLNNTLAVVEAGNGSGTVSSAPAGISCPTDCTEAYASGTSVTLTAVAATGSTFAGWSGACTGTGTCVTLMSASKSVTATFTLKNYPLTVTKSGTGAGIVSSVPAGINCGTTCSNAFNHGTVITLTAAASTGSTFAGWTGAGCSGTGTCVVTMTATNTVTATFTLNTYALTVTPAGTGAGSVSSAPAGINCGATCSASYTYGTPVTLTASAATGSTFTGWSGACSGTGVCNVTMNAAKSVTATFDIEMVQLTTTVTGNGYAEQWIPLPSLPQISCGQGELNRTLCSALFPKNSLVQLNAYEDVGWSFAGWSGAGCSPFIHICFVTMDQAKSVSLTFTAIPRVLTVNTVGSGSVISNTAGIDCGVDCSENYINGTTVILTATPSIGSQFTGWTNCDSPSGNTCNLTMINSKTVTATFATTTKNLTITKGGAGSGTVTTDPCNCTLTFDYNTVVTLTATPSDGSTFDSWNGCPSAAGNVCTIAMTEDATVTAKFSLVAQPVSGCTNPAATNYNQAATINDGSCQLPPTECPIGQVLSGNTCVPIVCEVGNLVGNECVVPPPTECPAGQHLVGDSCINNEQPPVECPSGTHQSGESCVANETPVTPPTGGGGGSASFDYWGCTNPAATNFNSLANKDDGSCKLPGGNGGNDGSTTPPAGEVLGAATTTGELPLPAACSASPYLRDYLKLGKKNDTDQVKLLQSFLNDKAGETLPVTGVFGPLTKTSVKKFQKAHMAEILQPWIDAGYGTGGLKDGTGYVYKTTKRFINIMMCNSLNAPMPDLTPDTN